MITHGISSAMHACVECVNILPTRLGKFVVVRTLGEMACVVYAYDDGLKFG